MIKREEVCNGFSLFSRGFYTFYVNRKAIALGLFSYTDERIKK